MPAPYILLAEDSQDDIFLIERAFRQLKLANPLVIVRDGQEALDFLRAEGKYADRNPDDLPEVLLLDMNMPKVGGLGVLASLRAEERTRTLPIVMLTTSEDEADIQRSYELGANSYIRKPVDFSEFRKIVGEIGAYWLMLNTPPNRFR